MNDKELNKNNKELDKKNETSYIVTETFDYQKKTYITGCKFTPADEKEYNKLKEFLIKE
jgi:hypothetical protein